MNGAEILNVEQILKVGIHKHMENLQKEVQTLNRKTFKFTHELENSSEETQQVSSDNLKEHLKKRRLIKNEMLFLNVYWHDVITYINTIKKINNYSKMDSRTIGEELSNEKRKLEKRVSEGAITRDKKVQKRRVTK